jgi:Fur family ferric uptake transcriptional regulator
MMHDHNSDFEAAIQNLKRHQCKLTNARKVVLKVLFQQEEHLSSSEIIEKVKEMDASIGRASIFRALELFTELGIIRPTNYDTQTSRYVIMESNGHHAHLVCNQCNEVIDLGDCQLENALNRFAEENGFELSGHLLELYGVCRKCAFQHPEIIKK